MTDQTVYTPDPAGEEYVADDALNQAIQAIYVALGELEVRLDDMESANLASTTVWTQLVSELSESLEAFETSVAAALSSIFGDLAVLDNVNDVSEPLALLTSQIRDVYDELDELTAQTAQVGTVAQTNILSTEQLLGAALGEDIYFRLVDGDATEEIAFSGLNAADEGTFTKNIYLALETSGGDIHRWASHTPTIDIAESCNDGDIAAPAVTDLVSGVASFQSGTLALQVLFDTDGGVDKVYEDGDSITITVATSGLAICSNVDNFVKTYNIVA